MVHEDGDEEDLNEAVREALKLHDMVNVSINDPVSQNWKGKELVAKVYATSAVKPTTKRSIKKRERKLPRTRPNKSRFILRYDDGDMETGVLLQNLYKRLDDAAEMRENVAEVVHHRRIHKHKLNLHVEHDGPFLWTRWICLRRLQCQLWATGAEMCGL